MENIKVTGPTRQKLGQGRNSWQGGKHASLYPTHSRLLREKKLSALGSGFYFCVHRTHAEPFMIIFQVGTAADMPGDKPVFFQVGVTPNMPGPI